MNTTLPEPPLAFRNRRILAERQHWPAGYLEVCERVEAAHPAWSVCWLPENPSEGGFERPARFQAERRETALLHLRQAIGATEEELLADIEHLDSLVADAIRRAERPRPSLRSTTNRP